MRKVSSKRWLAIYSIPAGNAGRTYKTQMIIHHGGDCAVASNRSHEWVEQYWKNHQKWPEIDALIELTPDVLAQLSIVLETET